VKLAFVNWEEGQAGASPALADSRRRVSA
jgi:hypothetical protein